MKKMKWLMPLVLLIVIGVFGLAVMLLWNWLMPALFGVVTITYWQSLGLFILCKLLFGFRLKPVIGGGYQGAVEAYSNPIQRKWASMSEEERKEFANRRREAYERMHTRTNDNAE